MKENEKGRSQGRKTGSLGEKLKAEIAISIRMESAFNKDDGAIFVKCRLHSYRNADSIPIGMRATGKG
jgi:hypothetical protein